jgi:hypothetical protein
MREDAALGRPYFPVMIATISARRFRRRRQAHRQSRKQLLTKWPSRLLASDPTRSQSDASVVVLPQAQDVARFTEWLLDGFQLDAFV